MKKNILVASVISAMLCFSAMAFAGGSHNNEAKTDKSFLASNPEDSYAQIEFDTLKWYLGTFPASKPERSCTFTFVNTGTAPLVINQALASCGCTVPSYSKEAVMPGEKGTIQVSYNGKGKFPGHFTKSITIRSNAKNEIVRLVIEGDMTNE